MGEESTDCRGYPRSPHPAVRSGWLPTRYCGPIVCPTRQCGPIVRPTRQCTPVVRRTRRFDSIVRPPSVQTVSDNLRWRDLQNREPRSKSLLTGGRIRKQMPDPVPDSTSQSFFVSDESGPVFIPPNPLSSTKGGAEREYESGSRTKGGAESRAIFLIR
jgi:hypothetical protein